MKYIEALEAVKFAATVENALKWEAAPSPEEKDQVCFDALGTSDATKDERKLRDALEDKLYDIIISQRQLRALGMGHARLGTEPVKVEGKKACQRCGGTGVVAQYRHINGGQCYGCGGTGRNKKYH